MADNKISGEEGKEEEEEIVEVVEEEGVERAKEKEEKEKAKLKEDKWLPKHAIINFDVSPDAHGAIEFHANMGPGDRALLLFDIKSADRMEGKATVYKAKVVDLTKASSTNNSNEGGGKGKGKGKNGGKLPDTALFYIHGFNNNVTGVFENCKQYHLAHPGRQVVPVLWADHQIGICGYVPDRVERVDPAGHAIADFVNIANSWAFPRRSLVCHSMGNYVLQKLARYVQQSPPEVTLDFDDIFMVAADVSARVFNEGKNRTAGKSDGRAILDLAKNRVHVLYSHWDLALKVRRVPNLGEIALGATGYNTRRLLRDAATRAELTQVNCSSRSRNGCMGHNYQFEGWAMDMYEDAMNATATAAAAAVAAANKPGRRLRD